ncbi:MAG: Hpt domain-containing protein [Albidovulum sp.]
MIDWTRIDELQSEIGADGLAEVVELFLDEVEGTVMRLKAQPDPATYEEDLHFLKGGAWNLGFADFGAICQDGERKAATGRAVEIDITQVLDSYFASKEVFMSGLAARGQADTSAA